MRWLGVNGRLGCGHDSGIPVACGDAIGTSYQLTASWVWPRWSGVARLIANDAIVEIVGVDPQVLVLDIGPRGDVYK